MEDDTFRETAPLLLDAVKATFDSYRWQVERQPDQTKLLVRLAEDRHLWFGVEGINSEGGIDVLVVNDAWNPNQSRLNGPFATLREVAESGPRDGATPLRIRLGRDLLFPAFKHALDRFVDDVKREFSGGQSGIGNPTANFSRLQTNGANSCFLPTDLDAIVEKAHLEHERALLACDALVDRMTLFVERLFLPHVDALATSAAMNIPLFITAADARAIGLNWAISEACEAATGVALPDHLKNLLFSLGFFHIYLPDAEGLRIDDDLDPNTEHFSALFTVAGSLGGYTLGCERDFVFHGPIPESWDKPDWTGLLKIIGEVFFDREGTRSHLYDTGSFRPIYDPRDHAESLAARIADLSENRISPLEAAMLMRHLAQHQHNAHGLAFTVQNLDKELRELLTGERLRPANVILVRSAAIISGLLRMLDKDRVVFRSAVLARWLIADALRLSFEARVRQDDEAPLSDLMLGVRQLPGQSFRWAFTLGDTVLLNDLAANLPFLLQRHRFHDGGLPQEEVLLENLWRLLMEAATFQGGAPEEIRGRLKTWCSEAKLRGLALPQSSFIEIDLNEWSFDDCNLRNTLFLDSNLEDARFINCLVSGAHFKNCAMGGPSASFLESDMSGVVIDGCEGVAKALMTAGKKQRLNGSIWTAGLITLDGTAGELDEVFEALQRDQQAISIAALLISMQKQPQQSREAPWPIPAFQSFGYALTGKRSVVVKTKDPEGDLLLPADMLAEHLRKNFLSEGKEAPTPPEESWVAFKGDSRDADDQWFVGLSRKGELWLARVVGTRFQWCWITTIPTARDMSIQRLTGGKIGSEIESGLLVAVKCADDEKPVQLLRVDNSGFVTEEDIANSGLHGQVNAMRWICPIHGTASHPELLVGAGEDLCAFVKCEESWSAKIIAGADLSATVDALGFVASHNLALVCVKGGLLVGFRHVAAGQLQELFRFKATFTRFLEVAPLNQRGQLLVVGEIGPKIHWALVQPSGNLVAVVPYRAPEALRAGTTIRLKRDREEQASASAENLLAIEHALMSLTPTPQVIIVEPRGGPGIAIVLTDHTYKSSMILPEKLIDRGGTRFRTVELTVTDENELGEPPVIRYIPEAKFQNVEFAQGSVRLKVSPTFRKPLKRAHAVLRIAYPSEGSARSIERTWEFALRLDWEDNPYQADGHPVSGDRFYGLQDQSNQIKEGLFSHGGSHLIVEACRRAGKTSFIRKIALEIRELQDPTRVALVVSGDDISRDWDLMRAIREELRAIGKRENRIKFDVLADGSYGGGQANLIARLSALAEKVRREGFKPPLVLFLDEWGYLASPHKGEDERRDGAMGWLQIGQELTGKADELAENGIRLVLTSVPGNFRSTTSYNMSGDWRFFSTDWIAVGRLEQQALSELIRKPFEERLYEMGPDEQGVVMRLASRTPHDANIVMHYAFRAAKADPSARQDGKVHIGMHHILPRAGETNAHVLDKLVEKYAALQGFLLRNLTPQQRRIWLDWAGSGGIPTAENPDGGAVARWDREPLVVPMVHEDDAEGRRIFAEAGYRERLTLTSAEKGGTIGLHRYKLWIPWGLAEYIRRYGAGLGDEK